MFATAVLLTLSTKTAVAIPRIILYNVADSECRCPAPKEKRMPTPNWREESVSVAGIDVHFYRGGAGPPLVLLHGGDPNHGWLQHHQALAEQFSVYAPSHPGFGHTPGLAWIATIADMALFYLWFLDAVGLTRAHLVGHDIGGWLAADMVTACPHVVDRLVLVNAMGLKPQHSEIRDIFLITPAEVGAKSFFDTTQVPAWQQLYGQPPTPEAADRAEEALETLVRLCWKPYMHELRLPCLLPRITRPTLIVWGRVDATGPLDGGARLT